MGGRVGCRANGIWAMLLFRNVDFPTGLRIRVVQVFTMIIE